MLLALRILISRLQATLRRRRLDEEFEQELQTHAEMLAEDLEARGTTPEEARRSARIELGPAAGLQEINRQTRGLALLETAIGDLRYALRGLRRSPGIAVAAIVSLALGIGANTAIFSLIDQVLFRLPAVSEAENLVWLNPRGPAFGPRGGLTFSYPMYQDLREQAEAFSSVLCWYLEPANAGLPGQTERLWFEYVSGNYFSGLGLKPFLGRFIGPEDDSPGGGAPVAVLSYDYWRTRFHEDRSAVGKSILINGRTFTVIGVTAEEFLGLDMHVTTQVRVPVTNKLWMNPWFDPFRDRRYRWLNVYARTKPGMSREQAQAALQPLYRSILERETKEPAFRDATPERIRRLQAGSIELQPGLAQLAARDEVKPVLAVMIATVGVVLLIACANIANLLLARATARRKEIAVRLALGASRKRLIGQLLTESLVLSILGGASGLWVAFAITRHALSFVPPEMPPTITASPDARVLAFNFAVSMLAALLFGLLPALQATRPDVAPVLKDEASALAGGVSHRLRKSLVAYQVMLSVLLLVVAGMFVQNLRRIKSIDTGFRSSNLVVFSVDPKRNGYTDEQTRHTQQILIERLRALPGVQFAVSGKHQILGGDYWLNYFKRVGDSAAAGADRAAYVDAVSAGFFEALRIPMLAGREFSAADAGNSYRVAVVNQTFARRFFPDRDPLGQHVELVGGPNTTAQLEIVGVVKDSRYAWMRGPADMQVYVPAMQDRWASSFSLYVRPAGSPQDLFRAIQQTVRQVDRALPVYGLQTMDQQMDQRMVVERMVAQFSAGFGVVATLLAVVGLYGVMAYVVSGRSQEIGIRMALGAAGREIVTMVMREVFLVAGAGVAIGLVLSWAAARAMRPLMVGGAAAPLEILIGAMLLMLAVATVAGLLPAMRASQVDPVRALRGRD